MKKWEDSLKERLAASPEYAAEYLSAVLEENDPETLRLALQHVAEAQAGVRGKINRMSDFCRTRRFQSGDVGVDPNDFRTVTAVELLDALARIARNLA